MENKTLKIGIAYAAGAYILWGFLPIYWKSIHDFSAGAILAHRIVWSFVFMVFLLLASKKWHAFMQECKLIVRDKKKLFGITMASIVISVNWLIFIWAVNSDHVIQASLGYYINPLISIVLGMLVLKEKLNAWQIFSFILAGIGVIYLTFNFGVFPWISIVLAFSFGLYGLLKKIVDINSVFGLTIETLIVLPIAVIYLIVNQINLGGLPQTWTMNHLLLLFSGIATAVPLLLFASGAKRIPLSMVGFLQYFAPTLMLILGVFLYHETFTQAHLIAFICIWTALLIYTFSRTKWFKQMEAKYMVRRKSLEH
ncbi:EamA family transporter RarD [Aquibacillus koreensis]|uniref:EamA family transporter RarD n=1 Tax=Aquibacillus koreensis TaxID=279446 RepID=A0A9X3WP68_9BACI|nr:EamA family transporter RarD [Aquibacillus koreensis]MCT2538227.1 EamA family transporter RarD [Aquibacillus koreensis]MDC3420829.1 EamA family transporter RarD [Aquibacillus koreensis]